MHNGVQTNPKRQEIPFKLTLAKQQVAAAAQGLLGAPVDDY
jgi:hypothetical protein